MKAKKKQALRWPTKDEAVDLAAIVVLGLVAMYGFHETFQGWSYLAAGGLGIVLGVAVAQVAHVLRQPVIVTVLFSVVAFFLLGGAVALHGDGASAILPVPDTLISLADQGVHGWKQLLTTLPPIDGGPLLTLPYLLGLVAGAGGGSLALRVTVPWVPIIGPLGLMSAVILLGVQSPSHSAALGGVFAVLTLVWLFLRARRVRLTTKFTKRRVRQRVTAAALIGVAAGLAMAVGPDLPGVPEGRVVLRAEIQPPFDPGRYPSLLASFRRYTDGVKAEVSLKDRRLMTITGLRPNSLIRFSTLNAYDGTVWGAANVISGQLPEDDTYQKVGSTIANPVTGDDLPGPVTVKIEDGYSGVWLPTFGALRSIEFRSERLREAADNFRYNIASEAGVMPDGLQAGDEYTFTAVEPRQDELSGKTANATAPIVSGEAASQLQSDAIRWAGESGSQMAQVLAVAGYLREKGTFTNGGTEFAEYHAGHSLGRLKDFVSADAEPAGNDEQYAATMALMANQLGVPARVVVGAQVPEGGEVYGSNVRAWVELRDVDGTWLTLDTEQFMSKENPPQTRTKKEPELAAGENVPPPVPVRPPAAANDAVSDSIARRGRGEEAGFEIPGIVFALAKYVGIPVLVVGGGVGAIAALKRERRKRRRTRGLPARRLALGFREILDQARDVGYSVSAGRTRREQATGIGSNDFVVMARRADAQVFGLSEPSDEAAVAYWQEVDRVRVALVSELPRWKRLKALVNLKSFSPLRRAGVDS